MGTYEVHKYAESMVRNPSSKRFPKRWLSIYSCATGDPNARSQLDHGLLTNIGGFEGQKKPFRKVRNGFPLPDTPLLSPADPTHVPIPYVCVGHLREAHFLNDFAHDTVFLGAGVARGQAQSGRVRDRLAHRQCANQMGIVLQVWKRTRVGTVNQQFCSTPL